jgi:type IV secretion system protein VirB2
MKPQHKYELILLLGLTAIPSLAFAASPFATGATGMQSEILTILTPIAVIAVMAVGAAAWFNKISWWWLAAALVGTVLVFGAPQIVSWIRGIFGI